MMATGQDSGTLGVAGSGLVDGTTILLLGPHFNLFVRFKV